MIAAASARLSATVMRWKTFSVCGTKARPRRTTWCAGSAVMSSPSISTRPENFGTSPATALISVDLPAPFGPRMATISPAATLMWAPRTIGAPGS